MRIPSTIVVAAALSCGCGDSNSRYLSPPELTGARAVIGVATGRDLVSVEAAVVEDGQWQLDLALGDEASTIDLLGYTCSLEEIGLISGELAVAGVGGAGLPQPERIFSASADSTEMPAWSELPEPPDYLQSLRIDWAGPDTSCARVNVTTVALTDILEDPAFIVPLDDDRVLLGTRDFKMFVVRRDGSFEEVFAGQAQAGRYMNAAATEDGTIYFTSNGRGCLASTNDLSTITELPGAPCLIAATSTKTVDDWVHMSAGRRSDGGDEVFFLLHDGSARLLRDGLLQDVSFEGYIANGKKGGVVRLGDGHALFAGPVGGGVVRYLDGVLTLEGAELQFFDRVTGVGRSAIYGALVVTNIGDVLAFDGTSGWRNIGSTGAPAPRFIIEVSGRFFLAGGNSGQIIELTPDGRGCDASFAPGDEIRDIEPLSRGGFVFAARPESDMPTHVYFAEPIVKGPRCFKAP